MSRVCLYLYIHLNLGFKKTFFAHVFVSGDQTQKQPPAVRALEIPVKYGNKCKRVGQKRRCWWLRDRITCGREEEEEQPGHLGQLLHVEAVAMRNLWERVRASVIDIHEELTGAAVPASVFGKNYKTRH